jgi:hypothetical protein
MMRYPLFVLILTISSAISSGCKKDGPPFPVEPEISIISVEPTTIKEFVDQLVVVIEYQDGDGDLGFEHPDSLSLRVHDARLTAPDWYHVPPRAPLGEEIPIQGTLEFQINSTFILGNAQQETTTFNIQIKDRAGNWSNVVTTPTITITK